MLLNAQGFWLKGLVPEDEWGFMYSNHKTFGNHFPEEWQQIQKNESGQFYTDKGLFTFVTIYPLLEGQKSSTGAQQAFSPSLTKLGIQDYYWKIVSYTQGNLLQTKSNQILLKMAMPFMTLILFVLLISAFLTHAHIKNVQADVALRESEERYHALYDLIPLMYFTLDTKGTILSVNQFCVEKLGYTELVGKPAIDIFCECDKKAALSHFNTFLKNPTVATWQFRKVCQKGHIIWVEETAKMVKDSTKQDIVLIISQDITERKQAEKAITKLVESEKMAALGGLVAGIAHELNTPMGVAVMTASTLVTKTQKITKAYNNNRLKGLALKAYFDKMRYGSELILKNIGRASELVKSFKQVAVDQTHIEKRTFFVKKYIEDTLMTLKPHFKKTPHQISVKGDEHFEIETYPGALSQIVTNLVMNSLVHAYPNGEVGHLRFEIRRETEYGILRYQDDGCGIPEKNWGKIFEPFFTTKRNQGGSGLGLHIVYNLVTQKLKGKIQLESGVGTTFIIYLPFKIEN